MAKLELTAIIRKGEKQYVALCPELDVVSQGPTLESALENLKEAAELYIEEMGVPKEFSPGGTIFAQFEVKTDAKASRSFTSGTWNGWSSSFQASNDPRTL